VQAPGRPWFYRVPLQPTTTPFSIFRCSVVNLGNFSEATWVAVIESRKSADEALQVAVLANSAIVNVNTAPLCFPRCALGFKKSLVAGHGV
jgi:hypothetical protein